MAQCARPYVASLPGREAVQLAEELEALGGGNVAPAQARTVLLLPDPSSLQLGRGVDIHPLDQAATLTSRLCEVGAVPDVCSEAAHAKPSGLRCCPPSVSLHALQALQTWLERGLDATVLLLLQAEHCVPAASIVVGVAAAALSTGATVGLSWQQQQLQVPPQGGRGLERGSASSGASSGGGPSQEVPVSASSLGELEALLRATGRPWALSLHVHHTAAGGAGGGSLGRLQVVTTPREEQGLVLRLLKELAGLHRQGCPGGCGRWAA